MTETPSTPQNIEIAPASLRDLRAIHELEHLCFPLGAWSWLEIAGVLSLPWFRRWKAQDGDRLVGFAIVDLRGRKKLVWFTNLAVHPDYRRQGLGSRLMDMVESEVNTPRVRLIVRASNRAVIRLYQARGYEQIYVLPEFYEGGEDAVGMEKVLKAQ